MKITYLCKHRNGEINFSFDACYWEKQGIDSTIRNFIRSGPTCTRQNVYIKTVIRDIKLG